MSELELNVGGRKFIVACAAGDEDRVRALADRVEKKFAPLAPRYSHNLLFAALQLADEIESEPTGHGSPEALRLQIETLTDAAQEAQAEIAALRETIDRLERGDRQDDAPEEQLGLLSGLDGGGSPAELLPALERFATLLESCAERLDARTA